MTASAVFVSRKDLKARRVKVLRQTSLSWDELRARAADWALSDDEQDIFDTVRGIDRMLGIEPE